MTSAAKPSPNPIAGASESTAQWTGLALEYLDQGVTVFDHDLRLVAWNRRVMELLEFPERLFRLHTPLEKIFRFNAQRDEYGIGDIDTLVSERVELARTFRPHRFERVRPDGTVIEVRGNPLPGNRGFVTTYTDITASKLTEQQLEHRVEKRTRALRQESEAHQKTARALHQNELWIRSITDAVPVLIAYIDARLHYQFANRKHLDWFNLNPDKLLHTNIFEQVEKHNREKFQQDIDAVLEGRLVNNEYAITGQRKQSRDFSITFVPHRDDHGRVQGFFFLGQDMTEHNLSQRQLAEAHKMQALGQMTGGIAHDFNNLLTIILGNLSLLDLPDVDDEEIREIGRSCRRAARRGSELIQRLLSFSRRQSLNPQPTDVNALISDIHCLLERTLGENIEVETRLDARVEPILVDAPQLETSLLNLALNARDALPEGGTITLRTEFKAGCPQLPGAALKLSVSDPGTGMSKQVRERVFEPFFSTKTKGSGTGLGLSMVYGFVRQSGGQIEIHSRPGKGCQVHIYLPADHPGAVQAESAPHAPSDSACHGSILVVEDDAEVRAYIERALRRQGYEIRSVTTGDAALRLLEQDAGFDLVLTDVVMPGATDGLDLAAYVKRHFPATRVLCMSGYSDRLDGKPAACPLLRKPFSGDQLAASVSEALLNE